ncbi:protein FAM117B-like [Centruroides sculpturatus]|uniref:protein FAM117B-like n=1 Tax=Centruroides sculpturatus TaxID=218467 RepID=UPI000C6CF8B0|nr:protein FAM117B-like [Centruroides sculpturatus]
MMSNQPSQRVRRTLSPSTTKQGPMKATLPITLMQQSHSPNKNTSTKSPVLHYQVEGSRLRNRLSPDSSCGCTTVSYHKVEKAKTLNLKPVNSSPYIRRTASLDAIYLAGQWQQDAFYFSHCGRLMMDRATQTPEEWDDIDEKKGLQKKSPMSASDQLEVKLIRQRLQRTTLNSRGAGGHSPVQGDHSAISSTCTSFPNTTNLPSIHTGVATHQLAYPSHPPLIANMSHAVPIPIPSTSSKPPMPRMRNSVEGLNQEIEKLVLKGISSTEDPELERVVVPTPDGHRAPIAELFHTTHSVNTQTPLGGRESFSSSGSRSQSTSPLVPIFPGSLDTYSSVNRDENFSASPDTENVPKLGTSPHINKFLAREPPDGCEKVKVIDEPRSSSKERPSSVSLKPSMKFVLQPSQSSAFYPLLKTSPQDSTVKPMSSSHSFSNDQNERLQ